MPILLNTIVGNNEIELYLRWLKPLFWYGKNHDLEIKDIYNVMPNDVSQHLGDKLEK